MGVDKQHEHGSIGVSLLRLLTYYRYYLGRDYPQTTSFTGKDQILDGWIDEALADYKLNRLKSS